MDFSETKLTVIPEYAFSDTSDKIILPETVTTIMDYAFYKYRGAYEEKKPLVIPKSTKIIGSYAFAEGIGGKLSEGSSLIEIGDYAFFNAEECPLSLPEGLEVIGEKSLWSDKRSQRITVSIPASVTSIGDNFTDRAKTTLKVVPGSYGALYASENGYQIEGDEDMSWLD